MSGKIGVIRYMILRDMDAWERRRQPGDPWGLTAHQLHSMLGRREQRFYQNHLRYLRVYGYVERQLRPTERRSYWYRLTDKGRDIARGRTP